MPCPTKYATNVSPSLHAAEACKNFVRAKSAVSPMEFSTLKSQTGDAKLLTTRQASFSAYLSWCGSDGPFDPMTIARRINQFQFRYRFSSPLLHPSSSLMFRGDLASQYRTTS